MGKDLGSVHKKANAWVSGLKEDLNFHGNALVQFQTMNTVGSIVGQLLCTLLFTILPIQWVVPGSQIGWGVFTLIQYRATNYSEMMVYRFCIGFFEAAFFPGVYYTFGSRYRPSELGRRAGIFHTGLPFAAITAGLIQSGASANLNNVAGLAGWRWMFIIVSLMTFPISLLGFFCWPGLPLKPNKFWIKEADLALHKHHFGHVSEDRISGKFSLKLLKDIFTDWTVYVFSFWNIMLYLADPQGWAGCVGTRGPEICQGVIEGSVAEKGV
ncbi:hypothetical protein PVAG01_02334 [Phlyctema vagabunda]|uniref:Uncharacterized protein n=1 Tax=Phlyctema vagabunda TaxID=108571 RepID=A0ABR4PQT6_9HELO